MLKKKEQQRTELQANRTQ